MKCLKVVFYALLIILFAWALLSWIDIIADNCSANPIHSAYNLFVLLLGK